MKVLNFIGIAGGLASIAGLTYALYQAKKLVRIKRLIYEVSETVPIAIKPKSEKYKFTLLYDTEGRQEEIDPACLTYIRFANFGRESIRRSDFVTRNPVRISITGCRILAIEITNVRREINGIQIESTLHSADESSSELSWEYLDHKDGAKIAIITDGKPKRVRLIGDIIGMPQGIQRFAELRPSKRDKRILYGTIITFLVFAGAINTYLFKWTTGSWEHVWLLGTPIIFLLIALLCIILILNLALPKSKRFWGSELSFLPWFVPRLISAFLSSASEYSEKDVSK